MGKSQKEYWNSLSSKQRAALVAEFLSINPNRAGTRNWHKFLSQQFAADDNHIEEMEPYGSYRDFLPFSDDFDQERFSLSRLLVRKNRYTDQ